MLRKQIASFIFITAFIVSMCGCSSSSFNNTPSSVQNASSGNSEKSLTTKIDADSGASDPSYNDTASNEKRNALRSAEQYLSFMAFSYSGLIDQLEYEGFTSEEAEYAAKNCGADWNEQAVASAKQYLKTMSFSKDGLISQLEFEGFTHEQAVYGAEQAYDSPTNSSATGSSGTTAGEENALRSAKQYLDVMAFSYSGLIDQLVYEGYSDADATYAADHCGADWNEQAVKSAKQYLDIMSFSRQSLIEQLEYDGYTYEQASYAATENGY